MICEKDVYLRALSVWGKDPQMLQVIEETADVEIMLQQLKCCYGIEEEVATYKIDKVQKISQRLDEWENSKK